MTSDGTRIGDRQLDEALRTIAAAPAPVDLPARVLGAIHQEAPTWWLPNWRPALGVALGVMAIALIAVWMHAPAIPREAQGSRRTAQGPEASSPRTSAAPEAQGAWRMAQGSDATHFRTAAPTHPRTAAPAAASSRLLVQGTEEVPALDPPAPLAIARLDSAELSERQLQVNALHVPALEMKTLER